MKDWRIYFGRYKDDITEKNNDFSTIYQGIEREVVNDDSGLIPWQEKFDFEQLDVSSEQKFTGKDFNEWYNIQVDFVKNIRIRIDVMNNVIKFIYDAYRI